MMSAALSGFLYRPGLGGLLEVAVVLQDLQEEVQLHNLWLQEMGRIEFDKIVESLGCLEMVIYVGLSTVKYNGDGHTSVCSEQSTRQI